MKYPTEQGAKGKEALEQDCCCEEKSFIPGLTREARSGCVQFMNVHQAIYL